ncbi:MAG: hypothetical protein U0736_04805 [Gemmataceae bacterium]
MVPLVSAQDSKPKDPLATGNNLPATFHSYNVNMAAPTADAAPRPGKKDYVTRGKFHCLISEYELDPTVMLLVNGHDDSKGVQALLQKLDAAIENSRRARLRAFVVFVFDDLTNVVTQDEKREELAKRLERLVEDLKLRHVVVGLADKGELEKYALGDGLTAVLYRKLRIASAHRVAADKLEDAESPPLKAIVDDVTERFLPKKKTR